MKRDLPRHQNGGHCKASEFGRWNRQLVPENVPGGTQCRICFIWKLLGVAGSLLGFRVSNEGVTVTWCKTGCAKQL
jgi:hypothetical protein